MPRSTTKNTMKNNIQEILAGEQSSLLVKNIAPSGTNRDITEEQLAEMIESVRIHGVIQPLIVRPVECVTEERLRKAAGKASHVLVAGERRWRSARTVGLEKVQVVIRQLTDREALELQAFENLQRKDLNDIEEAPKYRRLLDCGAKAEEVASRISKSRAHIYNCLKLLELPKEAQDALTSGKLDRAIALLIARIAHPDARKEATRQILAGRTVYMVSIEFDGEGRLEYPGHLHMSLIAASISAVCRTLNTAQGKSSSKPRTAARASSAAPESVMNISQYVRATAPRQRSISSLNSYLLGVCFVRVISHSH